VQRRRPAGVPERGDRGDGSPPYRGARSLLSWLLGRYSKVNGDFLRTAGCGIEELDARELCDLAYSAIIEEITRHYHALVAAGAQWKDSRDPLGDDIQRFEERIGLRENPEEIALMMHKQFMKDQGREWDDTPVGAGSGQWWDQDVEFSDMSDLDAAARRREGTDRGRAFGNRDASG
jgi:hypothetical protein